MSLTVDQCHFISLFFSFSFSFWFCLCLSTFAFIILILYLSLSYCFLFLFWSICFWNCLSYWFWFYRYGLSLCLSFLSFCLYFCLSDFVFECKLLSLSLSLYICIFICLSAFAFFLLLSFCFWVQVKFWCPDVPIIGVVVCLMRRRRKDKCPKMHSTLWPKCPFQHFSYLGTYSKAGPFLEYSYWLN